MIAKLKGIVDSFLEDKVLIDVNGVCYAVFVSSRLASSLTEGQKIELLINHVFKTEQQLLIGFQDHQESTIFKSLLEVPGIGVKSALSILSNLTAEELAIAIANQDSGALINVSGIGQKSAARILLELKDKTTLKIKNLIGKSSPDQEDAILGLISLGFSRNQVIEAIAKVFKRTGIKLETKELIVACLKELRQV